MKVNFFIIGAPKAGTTALSTYLSENPQICFSSIKETNFFCREDYPNDDIPLEVDEYHARYFSGYDERRHRAVGEGSAYYLKSDHGVARVLKYNPDAKMIVMLRDPVDMVQAWHREMLRWLIEDQTDLKKAWALQAERRNGNHIPRHCKQPSGLQYKDVCLLGMQVQRLLFQVPKEQVHIIMFDEFISSTRTVYQKTCEFLEIDDDGRMAFPKVHEAKVWKSNFVRQMYTRIYELKRDIGWIRPFPGNLDIRLRNLLGLMGTPKSKTVDPDFVQMLRNEFYEDILLLSELIGKDLSEWVE